MNNSNIISEIGFDFSKMTKNGDNPKTWLKIAENYTWMTFMWPIRLKFTLFIKLSLSSESLTPKKTKSGIIYHFDIFSFFNKIN